MTELERFLINNTSRVVANLFELYSDNGNESNINRCILKDGAYAKHCERNMESIKQTVMQLTFGELKFDYKVAYSDKYRCYMITNTFVVNNNGEILKIKDVEYHGME